MICQDCPYSPKIAPRAYCCTDKARERDKYERIREARFADVERQTQPRPTNRAERRRAAAIRRKGG